MDIPIVLYSKFLNGIRYKFFDFFKNDAVHLKVFETALTGDLNSFFHLIECSLALIKDTKCLSCLFKNNEFTSSKIGIFNKQLAIFFSSYYACPYFIAERLFNSLKYSVYTSNGMHLYDINTALINFIKIKNIYSKQKVFYIGTFYEQEPPALFVENINFIKSCEKFKRFAILATIGTILEPKHFYAIFIDKELNRIFIYNSCPKTFKKVQQLFSTWFPQMSIHSNKFQNQYNTELCGFFSSKFLNDMGYSDDPINVFDSFNNDKNMDPVITSEQKKFVLPINQQNKLVHLLLNSWFNTQ